MLCCQMTLVAYNACNFLQYKYAIILFGISAHTMLWKNVSSPLFFLTEPSASPANVTANVLNSTSILVSWGQVPLLDQNGVILSYTVTYTSSGSGSAKTKIVTAPANQTTLTGLNEHTEYRITGFASTAKGGGIESTSVVIITDEDSKFVNAVSFLTTLLVCYVEIMVRSKRF